MGLQKPAFGRPKWWPTNGSVGAVKNGPQKFLNAVARRDLNGRDFWGPTDPLGPIFGPRNGIVLGPFFGAKNGVQKGVVLGHFLRPKRDTERGSLSPPFSGTLMGPVRISARSGALTIGLLPRQVSF